ncbi:hypothetical protein SMU63_09492 [Streptococcus mutans T4]|nr:hypothetical protein SMU63_09492 [Streptococcus mutans T4]
MSKKIPKGPAFFLANLLIFSLLFYFFLFQQRSYLLKIAIRNLH